MIDRHGLRFAQTVLLFSLALGSPPDARGASRPNLLLFMADDMTYTDLGCYGNPDVRTPNLDRLAAEGLRLTRCYAPAPTCSPLRQSLYTGLYPVRNGAHPNHSRVHEGIRSLPHFLTGLGYRVAIVGKRHEAPAEAFPFEMLGGGHHDGGKSPAGADLPLDQAERFMTQADGRPWCLVVTSNQPHTPWNRGEATAYLPDDLSVPPYLVDTPTLREGLARYYAEITYMDSQVGTVLDLLNRHDIADHTVVLWLSEQGSQLPFCKWTCYDTGIHAAAIVRWPGTITPGRVSKALVSYVDVVPTFIELAGGDAATLDLDGTSFVEVLRGNEAMHHDVVFSTHTTRGISRGSEPFAVRAATDGDWLYIRNLHADAQFQNVITYGDPVFDSWRRIDTDFARSRVEDYVHRPAEELFDLRRDPWCLTNLADVQRHAPIRRRLSSRLDDWMRQQGDAGDATERSALERQPADKPWKKPDGYSIPSQK